MAEKWTPKMVAQRLQEAADILHRLPEVKVQGYVSSWPPVIHEFWEAYGWDTPKVRRGPPPGDAIDRMDEAMGWLAWLERDQAKLVWSRAEGIPWKLIMRQLGVSRGTAWQHWMSALAEVAGRLNA